MKEQKEDPITEAIDKEVKKDLKKEEKKITGSTLSEVSALEDEEE